MNIADPTSTNPAAARFTTAETSLSGPLYTLDATGLATSRKLYKEENDSTTELVENITKKADKALRDDSPTVTFKEQTPPSGDRHDYYSLAEYWWPNHKTKSREPYIRKDGQVNPETKSIPDKTNFNKLMNDNHHLAVAYYFTNDTKYAQKAAENIKVWFINPDTRMNPHLKYAQVIKGVKSTGTGLIDIRNVPQTLDDIRLIQASNALDADAGAAVTTWFKDYLQWLITSPEGKIQAESKNNHETWYDAQVIAIADYTGQPEIANAYAAKVQMLMDKQVEADGIQPEEVDRTRSWKYSTFNLEALLRASMAARTTEKDILNHKNTSKASITTIVSHLAPYASGDKDWPHDQVEQFDVSDIGNALVQAQYLYASDFGVNQKTTRTLDADDIITLAFPSVQ